MSKYLDIACQVLRELRYDKNDINDKRVHGLTLDEIRKAAGDDWAELGNNPAMLSAFAHALSTRRMRERGEIPAHYTAVTTCRGCGSVPIFPGVPETVEGCPWCFNRIQGLPVPHPKTAPVWRTVGHTVAGAEVMVEDER